MATFLDELARLNSQNFLGGLVQAGEAIKEQKQNEELNRLYTEFRSKQNDLRTTTEQLSDFNENYDSWRKSSRGKDAGLSPDVKASMDMLNVVDQMGAYANLYQPFITAFATLGEDGIKIANTLSSELGTQLGILEKKGDLPFKQLQLRNMELEYNWNKDRYLEWQNDVALSKDLAEVTDYIISNELFGEIPGGNVKAWTNKALAEFNAKQKAVIEDTFNQFGGKVEKSAISKAFKMAMDLTGKSFTWDETGQLELARINAMKEKNGISALDIQSYLSNLRGWSQQWINMNPKLRHAVQKYMTDGILPSSEEAKIEGIDPDTVKHFAQIFAPAPTDPTKPNYMTYYSILSAFVPGFTDVKKVKLPNGGETFAPTLGGTEDIIRPYGMTGFMKRQYNFNPYEFKRLTDLNAKKINDMQKESIFNKNETPSNTIWDSFYDQIIKPFDPVWQEVKEANPEFFKD